MFTTIVVIRLEMNSGFVKKKKEKEKCPAENLKHITLKIDEFRELELPFKNHIVSLLASMIGEALSRIFQFFFCIRK